MTIFYIIWFVFLFLSLVCLYLCLWVWSAFIYFSVLSLPLFMSFVSLCCLHLSNSDPLTQWIPLPTLLTKTFLNFTLFFFFRQLRLSLLCPTTSQQRKNYLTISTNSTLSIHLFYLYNARVTNIEWQSHKAKKPKKKKKKTPQAVVAAQIQFTITISVQFITHQ